MASNPPGKCCIEGVKHEGATTGKAIKVAGKIDAYLATPPADKAHKDVAILYVPDIFPIWTNAALLADQYAANGYTCLIVDPFHGDKFPDPRPEGFDIMQWFQHGTNGDSPHTPETVDPVVVEGIKYLKEQGAKNIGAVGYCFGAKYVIRHYKDGIDVGYVAHPSFVTEEELAAITGPLSIAAAEVDEIFPVEKRYKSEEILKNSGLPFQINLYSGVEHGFSVRGDVSKKNIKFAKEQAFYQAVAWFDNFLL